MPYVKHYDDCFLDALHNYLPDVLYGPPEQFGSSAPLVAHIQYQLRNRFDLFSSGQRAYSSSYTPQTPPRFVARAADPPPLQRTIPQVIRSTVMQGFDTPYDININTTLLGALFGMPSVAVPNVMESVIVAPTEQQIAAGTQVEIVDSEQDICTICQDRMPLGSEATSIRVCDHRFHNECINTWFQRSVSCPTCRHDVRDLESEPSAN